MQPQIGVNAHTELHNFEHISTNIRGLTEFASAKTTETHVHRSFLAIEIWLTTPNRIYILIKTHWFPSCRYGGSMNLIGLIWLLPSAGNQKLSPIKTREDNSKLEQALLLQGVLATWCPNSYVFLLVFGTTPSFWVKLSSQIFREMHPCSAYDPHYMNPSLRPQILSCPASEAEILNFHQSLCQSKSKFLFKFHW